MTLVATFQAESIARGLASRHARRGGRLSVLLGAGAVALAAISTLACAQMPDRAARAPVLSSADPVVQGHVDAAMQSAGELWAGGVPRFCDLGIPNSPDGPPSRTSPITMPEVPNWPEAPAKVFDNFYFVGSKGVSAYAIDTPQGIIITDAMWSYDVARSVGDGLSALGLDPRRIRYVIIPHGHPDHFGGAQYLHDTYGAHIVAPHGDLELIASGPQYDTTPIPEDYDLLVGDGDTLTLGDFTITFSVMPGHTPGGVVMSFPVSDEGRAHHALIWAAGGGTPGSTEGQLAQAEALTRLARFASANRIDVLADNHGGHLLVEQMRSNPGGQNPFLVGTDGVARYLSMRRECDLARAQAGRAAASSATDNNAIHHKD